MGHFFVDNCIAKEFTMVNLPERAARPLFAIRDENIKEKVILKCQERLKGEIGAGRGNTKKLTTGDVKKSRQLSASIGRFNTGNTHFKT